MLRTDRLTLRVADRTLCDRLDVGFNAGENWVILGEWQRQTTLLHTLAACANRIKVASCSTTFRSATPRIAGARGDGRVVSGFESAFPATRSKPC